MKVLLIFTHNSSLELWNKLGILDREILIYKKLLDKDVNISFLTYGNSKDLKYSDKLSNIEIYPIMDLVKSKHRFIKFFKTLLLPLKLGNLFKNVDIIKTNQLEGSWITWLSKILYGNKIIIRGGYERFRNYLTQSQRKKNQSYFRYMFHYLKIFISEFISYRFADAIILTNDYDIDFIIKTFRLRRKRNKIYHLPNYIDINLFKPLDLEKKEKHVLFIGRLHPVKNLNHLLKVFTELNEFVLNIIGNGAYINYLKKWNEQYDFNVNYLGVIPNEQLPKIINQNQIYILPSFYEGNPKTLLESMSCGMACIGTNVKGINNIIKHGENGYLCNTDAESIKNAILKVYNDTQLRDRISKAAREYIINNCSIDKIVEKEYPIYKNLLNKKPKKDLFKL